MMIFKQSTTGDKLRFLADLIEGAFSEIFRQSNAATCVVALGARVTGSGNLRDSVSDAIGTFARKFGVKRNEAYSLYLANYHNLGIGSREYGFMEVTPKVAARVLRKLAEKYDKEQ